MTNTTIRILVSIFAIPILLLIAYLGSWYFTLFILIISLLSFNEFNKLASSKSANVNISWGFFGISFIHLNALSKMYDNIFLIVSLWFLILVVIELFRNKGSAFINIGITLFGFLFFSISGFSLISIREFFTSINSDYNYGAYLIFSILATIWICDSAAFFGGTKLGKHKLFPRVSPNKSWEGAIFGFVASILSMILFHILFLDFISFYNSLVIGFIIGTVGQIGDLIESLLKRDAGIKDSSNIIPGHGGVFDRFDSLFFSSPFIYYYVKFIL